MKSRSWIALLTAMVWQFGAAIPAQAQLNENCVVSVLNRNVQAKADGTWVLPNIPANFGTVRARATCVQGGVTSYGESASFAIPANGSITLPPIQRGPSTSISLRVVMSSPWPIPHWWSETASSLVWSAPCNFSLSDEFTCRQLVDSQVALIAPRTAHGFAHVACLVVGAAFGHPTCRHAIDGDRDRRCLAERAGLQPLGGWQLPRGLWHPGGFVDRRPSSLDGDTGLAFGLAAATWQPTDAN